MAIPFSMILLFIPLISILFRRTEFKSCIKKLKIQAEITRY